MTEIQLAKEKTNRLDAVLKTVLEYVEELAINDEQVQIFDDARVSIMATADADICTSLRYVKLKKNRNLQNYCYSSRN